MILLGLLSFACSRGIQNEQAVRQGVVDYLAAKSDLNMSQMEVDVTSVSYRADEADATVSFRPKGGGAQSGMQMRYTLERKGGRWVVKGRGAGPHSQSAAPGGAGQMPPGHPPMGGAPSNATPGGGQMPAGHPPVGAPPASGTSK